MKMSFCALLAGVMVLICPLAGARADTAADEANAAAVVFRSMQGDLEQCFAGVNGNAYVAVEALVDPRGRVRRVEVTGDARAGIATRRCVERRVARARFPPMARGGLSRVRTSFAFARD